MTYAEHTGVRRTPTPPSPTPTALVDVGTVPQVFWDISCDLLLVADPHGALRAANPAWQEMLGWPATALMGASLTDLIHPEDRALASATLSSLNPGHHFEALELRFRTVEDDFRLISWSGVNDGGLWYAVGRDTTDVHAAERRLGETATFWQSTLDSFAGQVAVIDEQGAIVAVNESWRRLGREGGRTVDPLTDNYLAVCAASHPDPWAERARVGLVAVLAGDRSELVFDYPLGERWFSLHATRFAGEGPPRVVVSHVDVTARRELEEEARTQTALLDELEVAVVAADLQDRITYWNRGAERLYGWTRAEAVGNVSSEVFGAPQLDADAPAVEGSPAVGRFTMSRKDGSSFLGHVRWRPMRDASGGASGTIAISMDVSAQARAEQDAVATRNHLRAVTDSMGEGLFALDADGRVTLMNQAAESLLGWSLEQLRGQCMHDITHYRHADATPHSNEDCPMLAARQHGEVVRVEDDIFIRRDGLDLPVAYTASPLETATGSKGCVVVFSDATHARAERARLDREMSALSWIQRVKEALEEGRYVLYAQPIVSLDTLEVTQHELLLRVRNRDGTVSAPGPYLATAEEFGLIGDIDRWVIRESIALVERGMPVELNVSATSVSDPGLLDEIEEWLRQSRADASLLVFEITETALISNEQAVRRFVEGIHDLGCKVALDDFGTGYGGFTYLKQLPVDYLKIDIEFVRDLCENTSSRHVVEAVVNLARGFGLMTVAEGVEDAETLQMLCELGVNYAQGFHLGRPGPLAVDVDQQEGDRS